MLRQTGSIDEKHNNDHVPYEVLIEIQIKSDNPGKFLKKDNLLDFFTVDLLKIVMSYALFREAGMLARISPEMAKNVFGDKKMDEIAAEIAVEDVEQMLSKIEMLQADKRAEVIAADQKKSWLSKVKTNWKYAARIVGSWVPPAVLIPVGSRILDGSKKMLTAIKENISTQLYPTCVSTWSYIIKLDNAISLITNSNASGGDCKRICDGDLEYTGRKYQFYPIRTGLEYCNQVMCNELCTQSDSAGSYNSSGIGLVASGAVLAIVSCLATYKIYKRIPTAEEKVLQLPFSAISDKEFQSKISDIWENEKLDFSKLTVMDIKQKLNIELNRLKKLAREQKNVCEKLQGLPVTLTESEELLYNATQTLFSLNRVAPSVGGVLDGDKEEASQLKSALS
jgi:hypothetical protein